MQRFDLYTHVHKAIRTLLFDTVEAVGQTDFLRRQELSATMATIRRTIRLTREHAEHEDHEIHPVLHRHAPEVAADLEAGHDRFDGVDSEIEKLLLRIEGANTSADERVSLGRKVHELLGGLVADHLLHMGMEESRANRVLWAHLSDADLLAIQGRIIAAIPPADIPVWLELMTASGNLFENANLIAGLRAAVPADVFAAWTARARAFVGETRWSAVVEAADEIAATAAARA